ncbi:helix-turn-helix domain-containing protein [Rhodococcus tibetensis]|uniref:Helix-turn-helix domain-containing protein n=1 Tax=Rhodococcus tibetensis TaxID=2965064 RepID=A0ABT1QE63_9NOCA|nr:helix-turn-helix domain-containing protein [Rhodococcus sp. FXJ9.536]MCQ4120578.1 helix-turn-helix domain-containing protein [Rhodococcus sp. FXJ9.536]
MSIDHIVPALDADAVTELRSVLAALSDDPPPTVTVDRVELPVPVRDAVVQLLALLGEGQSLALGTVADLLTTSQAAEVLGVSDTYVRRLADSGALPIEMRGTHRRFRLSDVLAHREQFPRRS